MTEQEMLKHLQEDSFNFFIEKSDPFTGLSADSTQPGAPGSIAVTGMALSCYTIAVENNWLSRNEASEKVLKILRFFYNSKQSKEADATGYKGFYYHFLDMQTGKRAWNCELSTIDTALLIAGALSTAAYFNETDESEQEIRQLADELYRRVNWQWASKPGGCISHGWKPGRGFLKYSWDKEYSEAMILYTLAMGSPTYPIAADGYKKWTSTFDLLNMYDTTYLYAGPLFIHQFSHMWIDFLGIQDEFNRQVGFDYFENSRRATLVHRQYAIENKNCYDHYNENCWGLTASDGPGRKTLQIDGRKRSFFGYKARGAPFGPDDGTISPWAAIASLPFAPEIVLASISYDIDNLHLPHKRPYGFKASFNPVYPCGKSNGWESPWHYGINQGPIVIMIENYKSDLLWKTMKKCPYIIKGLKAAGFDGGWLKEI